MLESPEMFSSLRIDPNNDWIKLSKLVSWRKFDLKYAGNFRSKKSKRATDSGMALGVFLIKPAYKALSDENITKEIVMNPYLQYLLGLHTYRYECPFDPNMMTRFRQRIMPEMFAWVNDQIIGRKAEQDKDDDNDSGDNGSKGGEKKERREHYTECYCVPQNIRFSTVKDFTECPQNGQSTCH